MMRSSAPTYVEDKDSGERRRPHHIDLKTGKYRGRQILEPEGRRLSLMRRGASSQRIAGTLSALQRQVPHGNSFG